MTEYIETLVIVAFIVFLCWVLLSIVVWSYRNGITPTPTSRKAKKNLMKALPATIKGNIYELGSGWGTLALPLARSYPNCHVIAFESSPLPFFVSKLRKMFANVPNLKLLRRNFFEEDLSDASLIVCYLYPGAMRKLKEKFQKELKPGTRIVSNTFAIPGWQPEAVHEVGDLYHTKIYMYRSTTSLESLKALEDAEDIREARVALKEIEEKRTISLEEMKKASRSQLTE